METKLIEARYIGRAKDRADGTASAYAWVNNRWLVAILKNALLTYFGAPILPGEESTLYGVLGIMKTQRNRLVISRYHL